MSVPNKFHISWHNSALDFENFGADAYIDPAYPLSNILDQSPDNPTVFDLSSSPSVVITGSSLRGKTINCFSLHNHGIPNTGLITLELYPEPNLSGVKHMPFFKKTVKNSVPTELDIPGIDMLTGGHTNQNVKNNFSEFFDPFETKSYKLIIEPENGDWGKDEDGFDIMELWVDKLWIAWAYCANVGPAYGGTGATLKDESELIALPNSGVYTAEVNAYREILADFRDTSDKEQETLALILEQAKKSGDMLITLDPNNKFHMKRRSTAIYKRITDFGTVNQYYNGHNLRLAAREN